MNCGSRDKQEQLKSWRELDYGNEELFLFEYLICILVLFIVFADDEAQISCRMIGCNIFDRPPDHD